MPLRLKSLELHGYKTFANRAVFEFAETVTAIVGPNGSGKSNIADSLRWVLGEQSYSLLRGKKTEDMIFAGSESRARAGMASASITFDNEDGWLPIDFSEVAITRRAYRDGTNEYLINGQRVRLKDVSELLARSGLAERTYTVIGQGLVDAALSLKADERRRLFEEAAGIGLHRSRREEAIRRLDTTRRNLERVRDILAELKPRLHSLERQARRALEWEQLRLDLQAMLREWYGYHWRVVQKELAEARAAAESQEKRLEAARREEAAVRSRAETLRHRLQERRGELAALHRQLSILHSRREELAREEAVLTERIQALTAQADDTQIESGRLHEEETFAHESVTEAQAEIVRVQQELEDARCQRDAIQKELADRLDERNQIERQAQSHRSEISQINARLGQVQAQAAETEASAERIRKALAAVEADRIKAEMELSSTQQRLEKASAVFRQADTEFQTVESALQAGRADLATAEAELILAGETRSNQSAELTRIKVELDVLDGAETALTGYTEGARRLLTAARLGDLSGGLGALSSFLEVPAELEKAIAAALGEFLDALVLDGDLDSALDILGREAGRGSLLPLSDLRPPKETSSHQPDGDGYLGRAVDQIVYPAELRPVVELLLGQVWLANDRQSARRLAQQLPSGSRAVSLSGEVFHASGPVSGGSTGDDRGATSLSRNRRRRELAVERDQTEAALNTHIQLMSQMKAKADDLREKADRLAKQHETNRKKRLEALHDQDNARLAAEAAERKAAWASEQSSRLQSDLEHGQIQLKKLADERTSLEARLGQERSALQSEITRMDGLALDEYQTQTAHWNTRTAVAERALSDARIRLTERNDRLAQLIHRSQVLTERRSAFETSRAAAVQRQTELRSENDVLAIQIHQLNSQIEPAEEEAQSMELDSEAIQVEESAARQNTSLADHQHAGARLNLARRQEALASMQRRIEEDFGLVAFEYEEKVSGPTPLPLAGMVETLPNVKKLSPEIEENIKRQRAQLRRLGAINPEAAAEYREVKERYEFLTAQVKDLESAEADIHQVIGELDAIMEQEFRRTFNAVAEEFHETFTRLFGGGSARLVLTDPEDLNTAGIDIQARLPGRRAQGLALLSGGERSLTAVALVFSLLKVSPTPFCVLDEVDAMLDEMNVGRFRELLRELSQTTQFVIITHNRNTVQAADVIYGITMGRDSASQVLSLRLDEVDTVVE